MKTLPWANQSRLAESVHSSPSSHWRSVLACDAGAPTPIHRLFATAQTSRHPESSCTSAQEAECDAEEQPVSCALTWVSYKSFYESVAGARRAIQLLQQAHTDRMQLQSTAVPPSPGYHVHTCDAGTSMGAGRSTAASSALQMDATCTTPMILGHEEADDGATTSMFSSFHMQDSRCV